VCVGLWALSVLLLLIHGGVIKLPCKLDALIPRSIKEFWRLLLDNFA
jgi:hypothetical protein